MTPNTHPTEPSFLRPVWRLAEAWRNFWFAPADPTVLGLIRICAGLVLLYTLVASTPQLEALYGPDGWVGLSTADTIRRETPWLPPRSALEDDEPRLERPDAPAPPRAEMRDYRGRWGVDPRQAVATGQTLFSVWFHVTDPTWVAVVHALAIAVAVLFTLGLAMRVTAVLAWLVALSYIHRASAAVFGADTMQALLLLYLMIAPCGAALSLDRLIGRYRVARAALGRRHAPPALMVPAPHASANLAIRLLQIHFCIIYLASGLSKLQGPAWWSGTALWQTEANYGFGPPQFALYTSSLRWLTEHPVLWELFHTGGALFTLALEIGLPFLIWNRHCRWPMIVGAVLLHTGIALMMGLTTFSLLMLTILLAFVPPEAVRAALRALGRGRDRVWLLYQARSPRQLRVVSLVCAADVWGQVRFADPSTPGAELPREAAEGKDGTLRVVTEEGEVRTGYLLFERLARSLRLLWPLALLTWVPGASALGRARPAEHAAVGSLKRS